MKQNILASARCTKLIDRSDLMFIVSNPQRVPDDLRKTCAIDIIWPLKAGSFFTTPVELVITRAERRKLRYQYVASTTQSRHHSSIYRCISLMI